MNVQKTWILVVGIGLALVGVHLAGRWLLGEVRANVYASDTSITQPALLEILPFPCPEVSLYGRGLDEWQTGNFEAAAGDFQAAYEALGDHDVSGEACSARVNYALSLVTPLDLDDIVSEADTQSRNARIEEAITILKTARQALVEQGCASDDGTEHDASAEQLKEDIDRALEKLNAAQSMSDDTASTSDSDKENSDDDADEDDDADDSKDDTESKDDTDIDEEELQETLHDRRSESEDSDVDDLGSLWNFNISNRPW